MNVDAPLRAVTESVQTPVGNDQKYRGRLAPSPTGYLHLGHAATFLAAQQRAQKAGGLLVLRIEDLDRERCKPEFVSAIIEDLRWMGLQWEEGPGIGGNYQPYQQSVRLDFYLDAWRRLASAGAIYPCTCSRRDVECAVRAPHANETEAIYPGICRPAANEPVIRLDPSGTNWRFRVSAGEKVTFADGGAGKQEFVAGRDFGDFLIWRRDGVPAYQLAVVVDDAQMRVTEVVRGADLLLSTAQQLLLYRELGWAPPAFYHCPLVLNPDGTRLAKRTGTHSLRTLREAGADPARLRAELVPVDRSVGSGG